MSGSGVFLYWSIARATLSLSSEPLGETLLWIIRFAAFTAASALPLDCGYATDDSRCFTFHAVRKS